MYPLHPRRTLTMDSMLVFLFAPRPFEPVGGG